MATAQHITVRKRTLAAQIERAIDGLIAVLDRIDGDPDFEPDNEPEYDPAESGISDFDGLWEQGYPHYQ